MNVILQEYKLACYFCIKVGVNNAQIVSLNNEIQMKYIYKNYSVRCGLKKRYGKQYLCVFRDVRPPVSITRYPP